jgi:hypothetical protein
MHLHHCFKKNNSNKFFTFEKMKKERLLLFVLYALFIGTAAYHKLTGNIPPDWFVSKFESTFLNILPSGTSVAFIIIILLEVIIPILFLIGIFKGEWKNDILPLKSFSRWAFLLTLVLFLILTFGSFLVQDYDNGFQDFVYFITTYLTIHFSFKEKHVD